ncbi:MAG: hypothetical protein IJN96_03000 [Clostridia bacterium]|nr:hypothetical protein [Clostridia bacterium]
MTVKVNFEFYFNSFCDGRCGIIPAESFDRCIRQAEREVEGYLLCKTVSAEDESLVKLCLCEVAELLFKFEKNGDVKSETIDGYSVVFADKANVAESVRKVIFQRLGSRGLLFAGVE